MNWFSDIFSEVWRVALGAILVSGSTILWRSIKTQFFFKVFGGSTSRDSVFHLIYAQFVVEPQVYQRFNTRYIFRKPIPTPRVRTNAYSITHPVSDCEVRSTQYCAEVLARDLRITPIIKGDLESLQLTDMNYIAFGGPGSNKKSYDAIFHASNGLVHFDNTRMWEVTSGTTLYSGPTQDYDYGLILKVAPPEHADRERVWIVCAGFGEWGTSASARFLSRNWYRFSKKYGRKPFAIIVRVEHTKDDSAREVYATPSQ